ncbi:hypothetical protein NHG25_08500 [Aerococcaceae bacterium NML191292]|nr:hypothetical protein [Aerococcaceae bacterium NML191292]
MVKKFFVILFLFLTFNSSVYAYDLSEEQLKSIEDSALFFELLDKGVKDINTLDGVILKHAWEIFDNDLQFKLLDRKLELEKNKILLPSITELIDVQITELESAYKNIHSIYIDYIESAASMISKEEEHDFELLANRTIELKFNYAKLYGKGALEIDAIYQKIRVDY